MLEWGEELLAFFELGGDVLIALFGVTAGMWCIIVERNLYLKRVYPGEAGGRILSWRGRLDKESWHAVRIKRELVSVNHHELIRFIPQLKTLIAVCPLLGLLGTVTGMIEVFDVMAVAGSSNPRAMASGVSRATIPTMAGMMAALSGLYFSARLDRRTREETRLFEDSLGKR